VRRLLEGVGDPALAAVAGRLQRLFAIRSPWAPGLRFLGAQATPTGWPSAFSLGGAGTSIEDALVSCLGETAERLSPVERPGDVTVTAPWRTVRDRVAPAAAPIVAELFGGSAGPGEPLDWLDARDLSGAAYLLPADWCLRRPHYGALAIPGATPSTGCAAGPTREAAASAALLELVERDAAALWWIGGRPGRAMPPDDPALATLPILRADAIDRQTRLLDITTDLGIPAVAAVSFDADGRDFAAGLAARPGAGAAATAAIVELCQMEVGLQLARLRQRQLGDAALTADDRRHLQRAAGITADDPRFRTAEAAAPSGPVDVGAVLAEAGVNAYLVDLTRPDLAIPVVKAVAPRLQLLPGVLWTDRLRRSIRDATGEPPFDPAVPLV